MGTRGTGRSNAYHRWSMATTARRRHRVATLYARGLEAYEIHQQLSEPMIPDTVNGGMRANPMYLENPTTKKPFGPSVIYNDIAFVEAQFQQFDSERVAQTKGRLLLELGQLRRSLWARAEYSLLLDAIAQTASLVGVGTKSRIDTFQLPDPRELTPRQCERILAGEDPVKVLSDENA